MTDLMQDAAAVVESGPAWLTVPMMTAMTGFIIAIIGAIAAGIGVVIKGVGEIRKTTAQIEVRVNSEKTAAEGRELTLRRENELLREMLADKKLTAALLAQAAMSRTRAAEAPGTTATTEQLAEIAINTAETAANTTKE